MKNNIELPTLLELLRNKIETAAPHDKTINIKIAISAARMILERESTKKNKFKLKIL